METSYDVINAEMYAENLASEYQYNKVLKSHPHIFRHCEIENRPATNKDYYIPPAIADQCKIFRATFNKIGCEKVACFPKVEGLKNCSPIDEGRIVPIGNGFTYACQPACSQISQDIDTEFKFGKCYMVNTLKKMFALFPEEVLNTKVIHPLYTGIDYEGFLRLNENYCRYYALEFDPESFDCYTTTDQDILEILIGTTFYRSLKRIGKPLIPIKLNVTLPNYLKNVNEWLESNTRTKRQTDEDKKKNIPFEIAKDIAIDLGVDLSLDATSKLLRKRIPRVLEKFGKQATFQLNKIAKSVLLDIAVKSQVSVAIKLSQSFGTAIKLANSAFTAISIVSLVVDLFDPFNFNYVLNMARLRKINKRLDFQFFESNNTSVEITPNVIWNILEKDMSDYFEFKVSKMQEYLDSLTDDTYKEQSDPKVQKLLSTENGIFRKVFSGQKEVTLTAEERNEIECLYKDIYPNEEIYQLLGKHEIMNSDPPIENNDDINMCASQTQNYKEECNVNIYDPQTKKYYNPRVLSPLQRSKPEEFNVINFLREEQQRQRMIYLNFDTEQEIYLEVPYEEKKKSDIIIDYSLKCIAKLALILNQQRKDIPYTILEIQSEKYIQ
ncbi:hypothetical protein AVEN_15692-1 [Araneus ventricosus]|uniref:Baculoviridae p74 N-terminal domain-containing protein n=1 Tax=Araneus ventricosus TaxID=182803 RepID=A0A4Y2JP41_ARAVE|nr:hypothetical protein AVEN_15692-1 [Araneus ventricosus]